MKHEIFVISSKGRLVKSKTYKVWIKAHDGLNVYIYPEKHPITYGYF